jgi:hypothetical protein
MGKRASGRASRYLKPVSAPYPQICSYERLWALFSFPLERGKETMKEIIRKSINGEVGYPASLSLCWRRKQ